MLKKEDKTTLESLIDINILKLEISMLEKLDILLFDNKDLELILIDENKEQYITSNTDNNNFLLLNRFKSTFPIKFYCFDDLKEHFEELILKGY